MLTIVRGMKLSDRWAVLAALIVGGLAGFAASAPVYENRAEVTMPVIDAEVLLNRGTFNVASGLQPYDTQNTRFYTNFPGATIGGSGGFQFDYVAESGARGRATSFLNQGIVNFGGDLFSDFFLPDGDVGGGFGFFPISYNSSWILVNASNVVNRGGLTVGSDGLIRLEGNNVNLSRGGIRAGEDPFEPVRQGFVRGLTFRNDAGITDLYWGAGMNNLLDPAAPGPFDLAVLTGAEPESGFHEVLDSTTFTNLVSLSATNAYAVTNAVSPTNWVVQAVFVNTNSADPEFKVAVRWSTAPRINNVDGARMPIIQFTFEDIDTITTEPYTNYVYVLDSLGAMTNAVLATNIATRADQRPTSLVVTRVTPPEWARASTNSLPFTPELLYNPGYLSDVVTNVYAAYQCMVGDVTSSFGGGGGGGFFGSIPELTHPTNLPGRVEIKADRLDLGLSRFRTDGLLSISAKELVGQAPYKLDAAVVNADVGLSSGSLTVSNLIQPTVRRFNGIVSIWSAAWTNQTTSVGPDPADPTLQVTNTVDVRFHALIVDHQFITRQTVQTYRFAARADHLVLGDDLTLEESFVADAPDVSIQSTINLQANPISQDTFPRVNNLTNAGGIFTAAGGTFGSDARPISNFVNQGFVSASTLQIDASDFSNSGSVSSFVGDLVVQANHLKVELGTFAAAANLSFVADDFKATSSTLSAGYESLNRNSGNTNYFLGSLILDVSTRLTDGGTSSSNVWTVYDGVQLVRKPSEGDLLGTTIISKGARFADVNHVWAGEDRGATAEGFVNNAALGRLVLAGRLFSLYSFRSASTNPAALYVDSLEFADSSVDDVVGSLSIDPNFTLYFGTSNVDPTLLDGLFDGRVRWVQDAAGALSGTSVALANGRMIRVNRHLLNSSTIDSDLDGVPNAEDSNPFEALALRVRVAFLAESPDQVELSWGGAPGARYRVEYSNRLQGGEWNLLTTCESNAGTPGLVKACDRLNASGEQRFYRVVELR
jgi:hypothetical protein